MGCKDFIFRNQRYLTSIICPLGASYVVSIDLFPEAFHCAKASVHSALVIMSATKLTARSLVRTADPTDRGLTKGPLCGPIADDRSHDQGLFNPPLKCQMP